MNAVPPIAPPHVRRFTTADVRAMLSAGVLKHDEKLELIDGELFVLSPKHNRHEIYKRELVRLFARALPDALVLGIEQTLYLTDDTFIEPDLMVTARDLLPEDARGPDVLLAIEVADSSLGYDLEKKAGVYAAHAAPCLWVIDANTNATHVHTEPRPDGYRRVEVRSADTLLVAPFDAAIALRLADLVR